jgi:hypothetical protein
MAMNWYTQLSPACQAAATAIPGRLFRFNSGRIFKRLTKHLIFQWANLANASRLLSCFQYVQGFLLLQSTSIERYFWLISFTSISQNRIHSRNPLLRNDCAGVEDGSLDPPVHIPSCVHVPSVGRLAIPLLSRK